MEQDLFLEPSLKTWVLIPITITMVFVGLLRHYIMQLLDSPPPKQPLKAIREQRALQRGQILRTNGNHIPALYFQSKREQLQEAYEQGVYLKEPRNEDGKAPDPVNPLTDPSAMEGMMGGMKKQFAMFVPNSILMGWINFFFSGFILIKLPFPLTPRFKQLLQANINTTDMDVTWVSSLSWYFLNLFGLNTVYRLILGDKSAAEGANDMQAMNQMGAMAGSPFGGGGQNMDKTFKAEKENLSLVTHDWVCDDVEERVLSLYGLAY